MVCEKQLVWYLLIISEGEKEKGSNLPPPPRFENYQKVIISTFEKIPQNTDKS